MQRYFVNKENFLENNIVIISGDDVHHIKKVLRSKQGDSIICSNGKGYDVICEITSLEQDHIKCKISSELEENRESNIELILAQGLPKGDKMDFIIQKGTEIGVTSFIPFTSNRTVVQLNDKKEQKRLERWEKIAKEAAEQSHRSIIPTIHAMMNYKELLKEIQNHFSFIAYEKENGFTLFKALSRNLQVKKIILVIGPEGGFTEEEVNAAINVGAISVSLGKRILRTETAGLVGAANILYHMEQMM